MAVMKWHKVAVFLHLEINNIIFIVMKLYIDYEAYGKNGEPLIPVEITPEYIDALIEKASGIEKIDYSTQVITDITVNRPDKKIGSVQQMMDEYGVSRQQAEFALNIPMKYVPLFFDEEEYSKQIERMTIMRRILQETQDILNN